MTESAAGRSESAVAARESAPRLRRADVATVVLLYAAVAAVWILLSDSLLLLVDSPRAAAVISVSKGLLFVLVTSLLLYVALRRVRTSHARVSGSRGFDWAVRWGIGASLLVIASLGTLQVRSMTAAHEAETARRLGAIAGLKLSQVQDWLEERLRDGEALGRDLAGTRISAAIDGDTLVSRLDTYRKLMGYQAVMVCDAGGTIIAAADPDAHDALDPALRGPLALALERDEPVLVGPYQDRPAHPGHLHLDIVAPITGPGGQEPLVVVLRSDARDLHFRFLAQWPIASESAETVLARRDGDDLLYLGTVRQEDAPPASYNVPLMASTVFAARVARGELPLDQAVEAIDYRGVPILGIARQVSGTDWYLLAKIDQQEVSRALGTTLSWVIGSLSVALVLPVAIGILLWQRNRLRMMELLDRQREERVALARHENSLIQKARDMIFLVDDEERIVDVNESAIAAYGFDLEEFQALSISNLRAPDAVDGMESQVRDADRPDGALFETVHVRKDGTLMPVEISTRSLYIEGKRFRQAFVRDITERRRNEDRIARLTRLYRALSECNQSIVRCRDRNALFADVCRVVVEFGGMAMAWIGVPDASRTRVMPVAVHGKYGREYVDRLDISLDPERPEGRGPTGTSMRENRIVWHEDFPASPGTAPWRDLAKPFGWRASASLPIRRGQAVEASLNVYVSNHDAFSDEEKQLLTELTQDLSHALEHIGTRKALEEAEERWNFALQGSGEGVWDWDMATDVVYYSERWKAMLGYRENEIGSSLDEWRSRIHPDDLPLAMNALQRHLEGEDEVFSCELRMRAKDHRWRWILDRGKIISRQPDGRPRRMIGTHADITDRKETERALIERTRMLEESQRIARIGSWQYDAGDRRLYWSNETRRILDVEELHFDRGLEPLFERIHAEDLEKTHRWFQSLMAGEQPDEYEIRVARAGGETRWVNMRGVVEDNHRGETRLAGTIQDVTEWHAIETRIQNQLDELRRWYQVTLDREQRVLALKQEVNDLLSDRGMQPRYDSASGETSRETQWTDS